VEYQVAAREVGDRLFIISALRRLRYRTLRALFLHNRSATWGSAPLHPRLYAIAALRGLRRIKALIVILTPIVSPKSGSKNALSLRDGKA